MRIFITIYYKLLVNETLTPNYPNKKSAMLPLIRQYRFAFTSFGIEFVVADILRRYIRFYFVDEICETVVSLVRPTDRVFRSPAVRAFPCDSTVCIADASFSFSVGSVFCCSSVLCIVPYLLCTVRYLDLSCNGRMTVVHGSLSCNLNGRSFDRGLRYTVLQSIWWGNPNTDGVVESSTVLAPVNLRRVVYYGVFVVSIPDAGLA